MARAITHPLDFRVSMWRKTKVSIFMFSRKSIFVFMETTNNNILDAPEKYSGPRTCPNCGYQVSFWKFVGRYATARGQSLFYCPNCRNQLKFAYFKIQVLLLLGICLVGVLFGLSHAYFDFGSFDFLFVFPFMGLVFSILYFAKFKENKE